MAGILFGVRWPQPPLLYVRARTLHTKAAAAAAALQTERPPEGGLSDNFARANLLCFLRFHRLAERQRHGALARRFVVALVHELRVLLALGRRFRCFVAERDALAVRV